MGPQKRPPRILALNRVPLGNPTPGIRPPAPQWCAEKKKKDFAAQWPPTAPLGCPGGGRANQKLNRPVGAGPAAMGLALCNSPAGDTLPVPSRVGPPPCGASDNFVKSRLFSRACAGRAPGQTPHGGFAGAPSSQQKRIIFGGGGLFGKGERGGPRAVRFFFGED